MSLLIQRLYNSLVKSAEEAPDPITPVQLNILPGKDKAKKLFDEAMSPGPRNESIKAMLKLIQYHAADPFIQNNASQLAQQLCDLAYVPPDIKISFCNAFKGFFNPKIFSDYFQINNEYTDLIDFLKANVSGINPNDYLPWIVSRLSTMSYETDTRKAVKDIVQIPRIDSKLLETLCLATNNVSVIWAYGIIIPNTDAIAIQDKLIEISQSHKGANVDKLVEFTGRKANEGTKIIPVIDIILSKNVPNYYDYERAENDIVFLLKTILDSGGQLNNEIVNYVLNKLPTAIITLMESHSAASNPSYIIQYFISQNLFMENCIIMMLDKSMIKDLTDVNKFVVHFKDNVLARTLLNKYPHIVGNNFLFLQTFIEKFGKAEDLEVIANPASGEMPKLNFASLKKRYNVLEDKAIKDLNTSAGEKKQYIKDAISGRHGDRVDLKTSKDMAIKMYQLLPSYEESFLNAGGFAPKYIDEIQDLLEEIANKKDWFCLTPSYLKKLLGNPYVIAYKVAKNKTLIDMYHEVLKNNFELATSAWISYAASNDDYSQEMTDLTVQNSMISNCAKASTNFGEYAKLLSKIAHAAKIMHDSGINPLIAQLAIMNKGFDIKDASNEDFLEIAEELDYLVLESQEHKEYKRNIDSQLDAINRINEKINKTLIDPTTFANNFNIVSTLLTAFKAGQPISWKRGSQEHEALKRLHMDLGMIKDFESIQEYITDAKPKDEKLKDFAITLPGDFEFKVLGYLDPYAFKVGADTDCCQRINGVGEMAAIDSFVNNLSSVLILYKNGNLISQSYFHYIPEQHGLILDNVEVNERNLSQIGLTETTLSKIYADFAAEIKRLYPETAYVKCGTGYNKINNDLFGKAKMEEDPRYFAVDDPYSDFDEENHLDLLKPTETLKTVQVITRNANKIISQHIFKTAMVRQLLLNQLTN